MLHDFIKLYIFVYCVCCYVLLAFLFFSLSLVCPFFCDMDVVSELNMMMMMMMMMMIA